MFMVRKKNQNGACKCAYNTLNVLGALNTTGDMLWSEDFDVRTDKKTALRLLKTAEKELNIAKVNCSGLKDTVGLVEKDIEHAITNLKDGQYSAARDYIGRGITDLPHATKLCFMVKKRRIR